MRRLTNADIKNIVEELYSEAANDVIGLWEIAKEVKALAGEGDMARTQS
jgi:hypothetical protein